MGLSNDPRDTTTPRAIAASLKTVLLGDALSTSSLALLKHWLSGHMVADDLFRAALPDNWSILDRTAAGERGTRGIVAVIIRPRQGPIVATIFLRGARMSLAQRNDAIAGVGPLVLDQLSFD